MDEQKKNRRRTKVQGLLDTLSLDELYTALGRYCGPSNTILSEKKYGICLTEQEVNDAILERLMLGQE